MISLKTSFTTLTRFNVFFNKRGNNPYCHHRALTQAKRGVRERVFQKTRAEGKPFDNGEFSLIEEPINSPLPENDPIQFTSDRIQWTQGWEEAKLLPSLID
jgi:hypothetical protein